MASFNNTLFLVLLVAISAFMAAPSSVEAQVPILPSIVINGTVSCTVNATLSANGTGLTSIPPFANASVQLRCGNTTLVTTTTNSSLLSGGTSNCRIIVTTPLARCNATLPNFGNLVTNLTQLPVPVIGSNNVININATQGYSSVTFELTNGVTSYSSFLTRLRNAVEAPIRVCGLQSTRSTPLRGAEYIYVTLKISNTQWVTLGMDVKNMYVWGYQDNVKYNGNYRASFLNDAPSDAKDNLFRGSTMRTTRFGGNYKILEKAAGINRLDLVLGIPNLDGAIRAVYGRQEGQLNQGDAEAKFFLIGIQMVAEASRFRFMEEAIVGNNNTPNIKKKMVAFQNDWKDISEKIHKAEAAKPKCSRITPTLVISTIGYREEVNTVDEIKSDMGILKY